MLRVVNNGLTVVNHGFIMAVTGHVSLFLLLSKACRMACPFLVNMLLWDIHFLLELSKELQQTSESSGLGWINVQSRLKKVMVEGPWNSAFCLELAVAPRVRATCLSMPTGPNQPQSNWCLADINLTGFGRPCVYQRGAYWETGMSCQMGLIKSWLQWLTDDGHYEASSSTTTDADHRCSIRLTMVSHITSGCCHQQLHRQLLNDQSGCSSIGWCYVLILIPCSRSAMISRIIYRMPWSRPWLVNRDGLVLVLRTPALVVILNHYSPASPINHSKPSSQT